MSQDPNAETRPGELRWVDPLADVIPFVYGVLILFTAALVMAAIAQVVGIFSMNLGLADAYLVCLIGAYQQANIIKRGRWTIAVDGEWLVLKGDNKRPRCIRLSDVYVSYYTLLADDVPVQIRVGRLGTSRAYEELIVPHLSHARKLSGWEMWRLIWPYEKSETVINSLLMTSALVLTIVIKLNN